MPNFHNFCEMIFWDFKRRDNVEYNFKSILTLINSAKTNKNSAYFYKPIFIMIMGIIECVLYDLLCRVQEHSVEAVNLSKNEISKIKKIDLPKKLKCYVDICRKHKLLSKGKNKGMYEKIEDLIEIRIGYILKPKPVFARKRAGSLE